METITFAKLVENAVAGVELVRTNWKGNEEFGIWTGKSDTNNSVATSYVFISSEQNVQSVRLETETDWRIRMDSTGPITLTGVSQLLVEAVGAERLSYMSANRRYSNLEQRFEAFKREAQEALCEWGENNIDEGGKRTEFSEMMEGLGLEGIKRNFTASVTISYVVEVEVEAASEDKAREEIDNNLSDYIYDKIDVSYYEDYNIDNIEEA